MWRKRVKVERAKVESRQSGSRQTGTRQTGTRQTERAKLAWHQTKTANLAVGPCNLPCCPQLIEGYIFCTSIAFL